MERHEILDAMSESSRYAADVQSDPRFKRLSKDQQEEFLRIIRDRGDPKEQGFEP